MFYSLRGTVIHTGPNLVVIECGGVGYACHTTAGTLRALKDKKEATLYTHLYLREDAAELFGFADMQEKSCFEMAISVSGIGPKAALAILSELGAWQFASAVATGDYKAITRAQGVGPKLAQRVVLELKDKLGKTAREEGSLACGIAESPEGDNAGEAVSALVVLGYAQSDAARAVAGCGELPVEELIKQALKKLAKF